MPGNLYFYRENDIIRLLLGIISLTRYSSVAALVLAHQGGFKIVVEKSTCLTYNILNKAVGKVSALHPTRRNSILSYQEIAVPKL